MLAGVNSVPPDVASLPSMHGVIPVVPSAKPKTVLWSASLDTISLTSSDRSWEEVQAASIVDWTYPESIGQVAHPGFLSANCRLDQRLAREYEAIHYQPQKLFSFVTRNANPRRLRHWIQNLFTSIGESVRTLKFSWRLQRNCVPCMLAIDKTLGQFAEGPVVAPRFYQVAERRAANFFVMTGAYQRLKVKIGVGDTLAGCLTARVPPGQRACISLPVLGKSFSHAMNFVHMPSGERYILCGQQRKVFNLDVPKDLQALHSKYGVSPERGCYPTVALTGPAPRGGMLFRGPDMLRLMA